MNEFERFCDDCYGDVLRSVTLAIGDLQRSEDATQEAFARACQRWRTVSKMDRPIVWVYVVALNAERKRWRRERTRSEEIVDVPVDDHAGSVVTAVVVRDALRRLSARQRTAIVLRYLAGLSVAEVARVMHCADGTAKATLHQALRALQVDVGDDEP